MQSTFSGIEIGKRSLFAHHYGLSTIGHNLSNASSEGYSRQRIELNAFHSIYRPDLTRAETAGRIGQGVEVARIARVRDGLLERRIVAETSSEEYWRARDRYVLMLEQLHTEPTDLSVRGLMDRFWDAWQELAIHPNETAARRAVVERGEALVESIHTRYGGMERIRVMLDDEVRIVTEEVNDRIRDIAALNREIVTSRAAGDDPNDLLDRRDLLVEKLGMLVDIAIDDRDADEFSVYTAGYHVVQGAIGRPFAIQPDTQNEGLSQVVWAHSGQPVGFRGGRLAALLELRDDDVRGQIQRLDSMTIHFVDLVNELHRSGSGANGATDVQFFSEFPRVIDPQGNYDSDGDGLFDQSFVFRVTGANRLEAQANVGLAGTITLPGATDTVSVGYLPTDTVADVIARVNNSGAEVTARLNHDGLLTLKATPAADMANPDFVIRSLEDSGQFLVGYAGILPASGAAGAYNWEQADAVSNLRADANFAVAPLLHPAGWVAVDDEVRNDSTAIAAARPSATEGPGAPGNGEIALQIAALRNQPVLVGQIATFDDFFADVVAEIGLKGEEAELALDTQELILKDLRDTRESISGVNIDEEIAELIKFQHGYAAAARFIANIDQMVDIIINRMGV